MRCLVIFLCLLLLSGCSNLSVSDFVTSAGATVGAGAASAVGLPPLAIASVTAASGVASGTIVGNPTETISDVCSNVPQDMISKCVRDQTVLRLIKEWGLIAIYGVIGIFVFTFLIGYFLPNGKQRRLMRKAIDSPDIKSTDI